MTVFSRERQLSVLRELCRELARLGVNVGMSDARPAVSVRGASTDGVIWIEVDASSNSFVWRRDNVEQHTVDDPAGAAARLAEYLKLRDAEPDERS